MRNREGDGQTQGVTRGDKKFVASVSSYRKFKVRIIQGCLDAPAIERQQRRIWADAIYRSGLVGRPTDMIAAERGWERQLETVVREKTTLATPNVTVNGFCCCINCLMFTPRTAADTHESGAIGEGFEFWFTRLRLRSNPSTYSQQKLSFPHAFPFLFVMQC